MNSFATKDRDVRSTAFRLPSPQTRTQAKACTTNATPLEVLVIGYGNTLRRDDGAGPAVASRLARRFQFTRCRCTTAHQLAPELAHDLLQTRRVLFIDARSEEHTSEL